MTTCQELLVTRNNSDSMNLYPSQQRNIPSGSRYSSDAYVSNLNHDLDSMIFQEKKRTNEMQERKKNRINKLVQLPEKIPEISTKSVNAPFFPLRGSVGSVQASFRDNEMDIEKDRTPKVKSNLKRGLLNAFSKNSAIHSEKFGLGNEVEYSEEYNLPTIQAKIHSKRHSDLLNIHQVAANVKSSKAPLNSLSLLNQQKMNFSQESIFSEKRNDDTGNYLANSQISVCNDEYAQYSTQKQQPQQLSRNNSLYKFLNQYFTGNDPKTQKITPVQQTIQRIPHISSQENLVSTEVPSADNSSGVSLTSESDSQFNGLTKRIIDKQSSTSLRHKLAETLKGLPTNLRIKNMTEKTKKRNDRKIWTTQKDHLLKLLVSKYGQNWEAIAGEMQDPQIDSQVVCERFNNTLKSEDQKAKFSLQEDQIIAKYHQIHGSNWKLIAKHLPGRTEAIIRKRFHTSVKRKMNLAEAEKKTGVEKTESKIENSQTNVQNATNEIPFQKEDNNLDLFHKSSNFDEFRFESANPFSDFDHIYSNFPGSMMKEYIRNAPNNQLSSEILLPEFDLFARGETSDSVERKNNEMEIDCASPVIDSALPVEWENHYLAFSEEKPEKVNQFFDIYSEQPVERKLNFEEQESYWNSLIDFNQEPIVDRNLTSEQNSVCAKEDKVEQPLQQTVVEKDKSELMSTELNKTMSALLQLGTDQENPTKIHLLMSQIKSIEMLFSLTRKEIHKLQNEFGK